MQLTRHRACNRGGGGGNYMKQVSIVLFACVTASGCATGDADPTSSTTQAATTTNCWTLVDSFDVDANGALASGRVKTHKGRNYKLVVTGKVRAGAVDGAAVAER